MEIFAIVCSIVCFVTNGVLLVDRIILYKNRKKTNYIQLYYEQKAADLLIISYYTLILIMSVGIGVLATFKQIELMTSTDLYLFSFLMLLACCVYLALAHCIKIAFNLSDIHSELEYNIEYGTDRFKIKIEKELLESLKHIHIQKIICFASMALLVIMMFLSMTI